MYFGDVAFKGGSRDNKVYAVIAILIIIVLIIAIFFSTNQLTPAIIEDDILGDSWSEDLEERNGSSHFWGLEKWASYTYRNYNDNYPAHVTVTSFKTLFMMNEDELKDRTLETIEQASEQGIIIDEGSMSTGVRALYNGHKTSYIIYDGNDTSKEPFEKIKIIGESWNCGTSGTSIICIGLAQLTDNAHNNSDLNMVYWQKIIKDKEGVFGLGAYKSDDGLLFNIKCH